MNVRPFIGDYTEWLKLAVSIIGGFLLGIIALMKWVWKVRDILQEVNDKVSELRAEMNKGFALHEASTIEQIAQNRHNLRNDIQAKIINPLEELEKQTVQLGRDVAVLKDRAERNG